MKLTKYFIAILTMVCVFTWIDEAFSHAPIIEQSDECTGGWCVREDTTHAERLAALEKEDLILLMLIETTTDYLTYTLKEVVEMKEEVIAIQQRLYELENSK